MATAGWMSLWVGRFAFVVPRLPYPKADPFWGRFAGARNLSLRKGIGWLLAAGAVAGMILDNFTASAPLAAVISDLGAIFVLGLGMALIVA
jgi:hypothetical protein